MLTPEGQVADNFDKIMLLAMWAKKLAAEIAFKKSSTKKIALKKDMVDMDELIPAGMGQPTYPLNYHAVNYYLNHWNAQRKKIQTFQNTNTIVEGAAIDYGYPQGDYEARKTMAKAMARWYGSAISHKNILFTVGGAGALRVIFETLNTRYKDMPSVYRVLTPFPHYTLYADNPGHHLHPIHVMKEPGYKLTATLLEKSLKEAFRAALVDGMRPKVLLLCNPNNPLGSVIEEEELKKIITLLRGYPDLHLIVDEAYAEMAYVKLPSLLKLAPADVKKRIVIIRSGTKALSAAGERMAVILCFDKVLMSELIAKNISFVGHAPRSTQMAYAKTMWHFNQKERMKLLSFYYPKVNYVADRLRYMGAELPDPNYRVEGTFYVVGDFKDLMGLELPQETQRALGKRSGIIRTDEEIAYALLFKDHVMISPLSYYGISNDLGLMRITCSATLALLKDLMDRLETRLFEARKLKKTTLVNEVYDRLIDLKKEHSIFSQNVQVVFALALQERSEDCVTLKYQNQILENILANIDNYLNKDYLNQEIIRKRQFGKSKSLPSFFNLRSELHFQGNNPIKQNLHFQGNNPIKQNPIVTEEKAWNYFVEKIIYGRLYIKDAVIGGLNERKNHIYPLASLVGNKTYSAVVLEGW